MASKRRAYDCTIFLTNLSCESLHLSVNLHERLAVERRLSSPLETAKLSVGPLTRSKSSVHLEI